MEVKWIELKSVEPTIVSSRQVSIQRGFVRTDGKQIVHPNGTPLLLKGMGLGGWMLQEPYMLQFENVRAQWELFQLLAERVGKKSVETYRQTWLDNWMTYDDVVELKKSGFNSIRVPLHYNLFTLSIQKEGMSGSDTWVQDGFERIDRLLEWCESEGLFVILDMHAAPGGQGRDAKISDYDESKPSLWESQKNIRKTVALWEELAKRYAQNEWIAGYDLLNEPNWSFEVGDDPGGCSDQLNLPLKRYYEQAIAAIRQFDQNHIVYIQGNCWGANHNGLWPMRDDNVALSFHHYWVENTVDSIGPFLELRDRYDIPLWMGEAGENHNQWKQDAVTLLEDHDIGWSWWSWKKMESTSSSYSIDAPSGYKILQTYWSNLDQIYPSFIEKVMMEVADNALLARTRRNVPAIEALTGLDRSCKEAGFFRVGMSRIDAEHYCDMNGIATEATSDQGEDDEAIGWIDEGDWLQYNIQVPLSGYYRAIFRVSSIDGDGSFQLKFKDVNGSILGTVHSIPPTGSWHTWTTVSTQIRLAVGRYSVSIEALEAGWNLNWFSFQLL